MKTSVYLWQDEDGIFIAECPEIPGCVSQGNSEQEALRNIHDAIIECLSARNELGFPLTITRRKEVEVDFDAEVAIASAS